MKDPRLVIVDGVRTPFVRIGTDFAGLGADELGRMAVSALLARTGIDPAVVDEVIFGCVGQPVETVNIARVIALRTGIPAAVPALTVCRNCASGLESLTQAHQKLLAGEGRVFIVGGVESMTGYPLLFPHSASEKFARLNKARSLPDRLRAALAFRPRDFAPRAALLLGLRDSVVDMGMGDTAELIGRENGITREAQDAFAMRSHQRAVAAREQLAEEIAPAYVPPKFSRVVTEDNGPRENQSLEALAGLKPVFDRRYGTVTAGNASQITDGAVALLVMDASRASELGLEPLGALTGYAYAGCDPARMGLGPLHAIHRAESRLGLGLADADIVEINEAFAAQVLAVTRLAESRRFAREHLHRDQPLGRFEDEILNVNGGAIALGHPVGATGSRLILTALRELRRRKAGRALVSLCVGGGQGGAVWLEAGI